MLQGAAETEIKVADHCTCSNRVESMITHVFVTMKQTKLKTINSRFLLAKMDALDKSIK